MTFTSAADDVQAPERSEGLTFELALIACAADAYARARREVFDLQPLHLTERQRRIVATLDAAEDELRRFRMRRMVGEGPDQHANAS